jgi:predicted SAM-dependent methyltransferase
MTTHRESNADVSRCKTGPRDAREGAAELKLNIGCGTSVVEGWVNIDNSPSILLSRLPFGRRIFRTPDWPRGVRRADVRKGIPFPDSSVSIVYSSHTFEHFTYEESLAVSRECFRVLSPGGILRIVVPDLGIMVRDYLAGAADPMASHRFVSRLLLTTSVRDILHPGAHHKQMFDARSLAHMLQEAGFPAPELSAFASSRIAEIAEIELESRRSESLYVEAIR